VTGRLYWLSLIKPKRYNKLVLAPNGSRWHSGGVDYLDQLRKGADIMQFRERDAV
jgi:hypothetical protein